MGYQSNADRFNMSSGSYVGDGAVSQEISCPGLVTIKYLMIMNKDGDGEWVKSDQHAATSSHTNGGQASSNAFAAGFSGNRFYVDDNGTDAHPNKNTNNYIFIAWGL